MASLRIERISSLAQLSTSVRREWENLPRASPMQSPDWLTSWWEVFGDASRNKSELCILLVRKGERLVAVAPWYLQRNWPHGYRFRFLGDGLVCSDHATVAIHCDVAVAEVAESLAGWLNDHAAKQWTTICFDSISRENQLISILVQKLSAAGCDFHSRSTSGTWCVDLPDTFDAYLAGLSKNHRKRCRRWWRKYFETGLVRTTISSSESCAAAWAEISRLNQQRREILGDRSVFAEDRFHDFHLSVLPQLIENREAELRELKMGERTIAAEYMLVHKDTLFCYQSGMEISTDNDGYGNLSLLSLFHDAIERGFRQIDFLRGDEAYKQHWGATRHGCENYFLAAKSLAGGAQVTCYRAANTMRALRDFIKTPT